MPELTRRQLLLSLPALAVAPRLFAQAAPLRARGLNHLTLSVSDPKRTIDFYQGLFGMPIQAHQGPTTALRVGTGRSALRSVRSPRTRRRSSTISVSPSTTSMSIAS